MVTRAETERASYNEGAVTEASRALHRRFEHVFTCPNAQYAEDYWSRQLERCVPDREVLEIGCFDGSRLLQYKQMGAKRITGIDISDVLVEKARARGCDAQVMDGGHLQFPDASFDTVIGGAVLHHLDYDRAIQEIHRVLRPGGTAVFTEPLRGNPAWKLFRALTPNARTESELPLSREQIERADRLFHKPTHCFVGLASTAIGSVTSFLPVSDRNWALRIADSVDRRLARGPLRYWMRHVILVWEKPGGFTAPSDPGGFTAR
jgi:SAM-dependent methyltransferase